MKHTRESLTEFVHSEMSRNLDKKFNNRDIINGDVFYRKKYDWGWDYCSLSRVLFLETHLEFGINFTRRYNFIENIWNEFASLINCSSNDQVPSIIIQQSNASEEIKQKGYFNGSLRFEISEKGLAEIPEATEFVMNKIFKKMDLFLDIRELDKYVNTQFHFDEQLHSVIYWEGLMYKRIVVSKLANSPNYETLCNFMRTTFDWYNEHGKVEGQEYLLNYPIVFEKVYEKLKHIEPLSNTILSNEAV